METSVEGKQDAGFILPLISVWVPATNSRPETHEAQRLYELSEETPAEASPAALRHDSRSESTTTCLYRALISS